MTLHISEARNSILLSALEVPDRNALFADAREMRFAPGQMLFLEGEPGLEVMLLTSGRVEVSVMSESGRKSILAHMGEGELLGEIAALDGGPRSASVVAVSETTCLVVSRTDVLNFVVSRPEVARAVMIELCKKVRNASEMFETRAVVEGGPRLATALLRLFDKWGADDGAAVVLNQQFSQSEIGDFSGLARENVNRYLKGWIADGLLESRDGYLVLLDRGRLSELAEH